MRRWPETSVAAVRTYGYARGSSMLPDRSGKPESPAVTRRDLLRSGAAITGGLLIGIEFGLARGAEPIPSGARLNAFVHVAPDDRVTLTMPAVEMGQGVYTSQAMCLAEELDVGLDQVVAAHAPPDQADYGSPVFVIQATGGSTTTSAWYLPLRRAGAIARLMLLQAAASAWRVDPSTLTTDRGVITHTKSGRTLRYGQVASRAANLQPHREVELKDPSRFRLIGKPTRRIDTPDKAIGKTVYGIDVILPGLKFATLKACPVLGGKVATVDQTAALTVPGVRQVVVLDDLVAVVGDHMWAALQGMRALAIEWSLGRYAALDQADLWQELEKASQGPGVTAQRQGDALEKLQEGSLFEATFEFPFLAHAPMEPMNCTVHVRDGTCEVWVGTQVPGMAQAVAAKVLGVEPSAVTVNNHFIGGGFGRRLEADGIEKATRIAQHVDGPVKVVWTREEDITQQRYRPLYHDRLKARVQNGKITAWHHRVTGGSIMARWLPPAFTGGIDVDAVDGAVKSPYDVGDVLVEYVRHELPVEVAFWRGVGPNSSVCSVECFVDDIAHRTNVEPMEFRRTLLAQNPRALGVLTLVAQRAQWGTPAPASPLGPRVGRGIALLANAFGSYLACVADVAVSDQGDVRVTRAVVAADCGRVVNPDTLVAQVQGGVVFGITAVLHNKITFARGRVEQSNYNNYRMLRIDEMPLIEVHLVPSTQAPGGIGEPGTVVVQPAVANAVFAATGVRLTRMPIDRELIAKTNG
jgi:isoquinoline 1-oxidoreductase subunit beta